MEYSKERQLKRSRQKIPFKRRKKFVLDFPQHVKDSIKLRDGKCCICQTRTEYLTAHHFVYKSAMGMGVIENGVALCHSCHDRVHRHDYDGELKQHLQEYLDRLYPEFDNSMRKYKKWR